MNVHEAAKFLDEDLRKIYNNIQAVGVRENNVEAYKANPKKFAKEITEDSLIVYTITDPSFEQLALMACNGYNVMWKKSGKLRTVS